MLLYNGNCIDVMESLSKKGVIVDAVITDPPYGTTACEWDSPIPFDKMWECLKCLRKESTPILLFGAEPYNSYLRISNINEFKYDIYWEKERVTNIFQVKKRPGKVIETISVFYKKQPTYNPQMVPYIGEKRTNKIKNGKLGTLVDSQNRRPIEYVDTGYRYPTQLVKFKRDILTSNLHPTQKPLDLIKYLVNTYTKEGDVVLDFTMGSGTTGVACKLLNRKFIGIEIDRDYFNIATRRIQNTVEEPFLFKEIV